MKIRKAEKEDCNKISQLMKNDLSNPPREFSENFLEKFKEHAKEENLLEELNNPNLIGFVAITDEEIVGFIVGYLESIEYATIHYINGRTKLIKNDLLREFISHCKNKNLDYILADSFEFMENDSILESEGFTLEKEEEIDNSLIMFWRKLILK